MLDPEIVFQKSKPKIADYHHTLLEAYQEPCVEVWVMKIGLKYKRITKSQYKEVIERIAREDKVPAELQKEFDLVIERIIDMAEEEIRRSHRE
jgi:hypothetical protein